MNGDELDRWASEGGSVPPDDDEDRRQTLAEDYQHTYVYYSEADRKAILAYLKLKRQEQDEKD